MGKTEYAGQRHICRSFLSVLMGVGILARAFGTPVGPEKTVSGTRHKLIEAGGNRDELALIRGSVCGCAPRHRVEPAGATERVRVRTAIGQQRVEHLSHRNQTCLRVD
jgi:hypothetical protein